MSLLCHIQYLAQINVNNVVFAKIDNFILNSKDKHGKISSIDNLILSLMQYQPIGIIHTPYKQKFAVPRQPNLVDAASGYIELAPDYADANALRGIEQFSHLWILFDFHQTRQQGWSPLVRPPRLGGNKKVGIFASRSTFRPNSIGMSVVRLINWRWQNKKLIIEVGGVDLVDGTPVLDIKPYLPYADAITDARGGFGQHPPETICVQFSPTAMEQINQLQQRYPQLQTLITQVVSQDPRPAYQRDELQQYGINLYDLNIRTSIQANQATILSIIPVGTDSQ